MFNVCLFAALLAPGTLSIEVLEGAGAISARNAVSPQRFLVQVKDASGAPAPSVTISFKLPTEGPSGEFASGLKSESTLTGPDGKAYVRGIHWNSTSGKLDILVVASSQGERIEARIPVEISASLPASRRLESKSNKKWLILAVVAGGAIGGLAAMRGGGNAQSAVVAPPNAAAIPPSMGTPVISIGKP